MCVCGKRGRVAYRRASPKVASPPRSSVALSWAPQKIKAHQTHTTRARSLRPMIHIRVAQLVRRDAKGRADEPRPTNLV